MYRKNNVPPDAKDLPAFLNQELSNIERAQNEPVSFLRLEIAHKPPPKVEDGLYVDADGVDWNPGSGAGLYRYRAGAWVFVG